MPATQADLFERPEVTLADLVERFGPIPMRRIRSFPGPGIATEQDVLDVYRTEKRLCELVDGVLVEKDLGYFESVITLRLGAILLAFVDRYSLGVVAGESGMLRLLPGLIRIPDLSFISWGRLPDRKVSPDAVIGLAADLAVEILSRGNTKEEMDRKIRDYFETGTRLVWIVDPRRRSVRVLVSADSEVLLLESDVLDGELVLPGFRLRVGEIFDVPGSALS